MRYFIVLSLVLCWCLMFECSRGPLMVAGSSSSGNAKVSGFISNNNGTPAGQTAVLLIPSDFNPLTTNQELKNKTVFMDTTDSKGGYVFQNIPKDTYFIEAKSVTEKTKLLIKNIDVDSDTIVIQKGVLQKTCSIKVMLPANIDPANGYVYIPGTDAYALINNQNDFVLLDSVPASPDISINYAVKGTTAAPRKLADSLSLSPDSALTVYYSAWLYSKKLYFNTTVSGANVNAMVTNFPVLVRLNAGNFDFTQARSDGADIRFANSNNIFLPYEMERWDPIAQLAEAWVKVDTIFGNSSSQSITLYCGNANAGASSNSAAVFDTANGFQGVWHLAQASGLVTPDATLNHYDGTMFNVSALSVAGAIGPARQFNGQSGYIVMQGTAAGSLDFSKNGVYSVSAWVNVDSLNGRYRIIASKGNKQYNLQLKNTNEWEFAEFRDTPQDSVGWEESTVPAASGAWTYVVGLRSGSMQRLYVNGECVDSSYVLYPLKTSDSLRTRDQTNDFTIGKLPGLQSYFFNGKIDEVRVSNRELRADWIRLCYMNQRTDDKLVVFK